MQSRKAIFILMGLMLVWSKAGAWQLVGEKSTGNILLRDEGGGSSYANIIGEKEGFDRRFITLNGFAALQVSGRDDFYYTLAVRGREVFIDCAYANARNIYNGAQVTAGMCGLNKPLEQAYDEVGTRYSNQWQQSIFSFDTKSLFETGRAQDFLIGVIGNVEVFDRYFSIYSIENSSPQKVIKSASGCFYFGSAMVFLVFEKSSANTPRYLDVFQSVGPIRLQRMQEADLERLAVDECV
ncbi:hypothetical protein D3C76_1105200 [compost metagenome]|jgi:hypothetical protein|uniref:hypothetical protein n=1 Tax=Pseudomonas sp. YuFO20 TaxID=3095362 RepID=UPI000FB8280A|nr:hypothetical protein [Pseudomonas sp. YuFO20]MEB2519731.1 hypothetical protein [Pseudomonas sp. YuFO20]